MDAKIWINHGKKNRGSHQKEIETCIDTSFCEQIFHGSLSNHYKTTNFYP